MAVRDRDQRSAAATAHRWAAADCPAAHRANRLDRFAGLVVDQDPRAVREPVHAIDAHGEFEPRVPHLMRARLQMLHFERLAPPFDVAATCAASSRRRSRSRIRQRGPGSRDRHTLRERARRSPSSKSRTCASSRVIASSAARVAAALDHTCSSAWWTNSPRSRSLNPGTGRSRRSARRRVSAKPRNAQRDCALKRGHAARALPRAERRARSHPSIARAAGRACSSACQCGRGNAGSHAWRTHWAAAADWARRHGRRRGRRS